MTIEDNLRNLPSVESVLGDERVVTLLEKMPRRLALIEVREYLSELREAIRLTTDHGGTEIAASPRRRVSASSSRRRPSAVPCLPQFDWPTLLDRLERRARTSLRRAINAVGVVLHTGMGRAALSKSAQAALQDVSENFCNLAIDADTGRRGERYAHVTGLLCELTGAESAMVVNNNAAATMLILNTLAAGKEAIISRGQLVEIGGAFRIPDIMLRSGVRMVEVGTTNRTHLRDYRSAITPETGLLIRVHMSNYRIIGFTTEVPISGLVELGREFKLPVVDDLGSGALVDLSKYGLPKEPLVQDSVAAGADIVCFSGDKLLGGPQSGIIVGRRSYIDQMKKNPLTRALRCGKLTYAALEATLRLFLDEEKLIREHAVMSLLLKPRLEMERQARKLLRAVKDLTPHMEFKLREATSKVGSGSLAAEQLPTIVVSVRTRSQADSGPGLTADELTRRLRRSNPPVFGRIENGELLLDFRTIREDEIALVARAMHEAVETPDMGTTVVRTSPTSLQRPAPLPR
jgi:L-seryl-tRNA(Ser) seleniumtransferase